MPPWQIIAFVYLMICLTVRMAPFPGNAHGHIGAIAAVGCILALVGTISVEATAMVEQAWPLLSLTVGWLMLLLMASLVACGFVSTVRALAKWA